MTLSSKEVIRYSRQIILEGMGVEGQQRLKQARVLVIGAGGLGCPVLQYLAAAGIGTLGIAEFDQVEATNLHRQVLYGPEDIGRDKVEVAVERLSSQNPFVKFDKHGVKITGENAAEIIKGYDLVLDGCDNFETRYVVNDTCVDLGKPLVYGSILGFQGQLAVFNHKGSKNLRHIFPELPDPKTVPDCSQNGVLGTVPGIVGTMMAQLAIQVILGRDVPVNEFMLLDTTNLDIRKLRF